MAKKDAVWQEIARHLAVRNRHVFLADCVAIPAAAMLSFAFRFDGLDAEYLPYLMPSVVYLALALAVKLPILRGMGMYSQAWRYAGRREALNLGWSTIVFSAILSALVYFVFNTDGLWTLVMGRASPGFPRSVLFIDALLSLNMLGAVRVAAKIFSVGSVSSSAAQLLHTPARVSKRVLLVGAGDAGAAIAGEMRSNPGLGLVPVGFIDDDPHKRGVFVQGIRVLGTRQDIPKLARRHSIEQVLMTLPTAPGRVIRETVSLCQQSSVPCRTLPGIYELIDGSVRIGQSREVRIEDLLRREPVALDISAIAGYLTGARVLVTGAGGSIGSELCRQIGRFSPELIVLLGHGENSIYLIEKELRQRLPRLSVVPAIADIRDEDRVRAVMTEYRPTVVFHAAAHKHVPLMESHVCEVVGNNVLGTWTVMGEAERAEVGRFVFVSTDKAANPVNILGATKRLGEMLVCDSAHRNATAYAAVRFGNVLGSRGSVVPVFMEQIAAGGPIKVTHPDVARYFMTIPEAAQLIVQAGALCDGGEVFILDMGDPVRIVDLAADLVRLSGLRLGQNIDIVFSGLRPGEKLREILMTEEETDVAVRRQGVLMSRLARVYGLERQISALRQLVASRDPDAVIAKMREVVPEYEPVSRSTVLAPASAQ